MKTSPTIHKHSRRVAVLRRSLTRNDCLPVRRPLLEGLLTPAELADLPPSRREQKFKEWENYREQLMKLEKLNFEAGLIRVRLCAILNGFRAGFTGTPVDYKRHYSWCVCDEWMKSFKNLSTDI